MKFLTLTFLLVFSSTAFARQYIQCSSSETSDVMVVNLQTDNGGTLFISSGMQNPEDERVLVDIAFAEKKNGKHYYKVIDDMAQGSVSVPSNLIGKATSYLPVELVFNGYNASFSCFASIYND